MSETAFDNPTISEAEAALRTATPADLDTNRAFYAGDHWQAGQGWVGPMPPQDTAEGLAVCQEIKRAFVASNAIGEVTQRHVAGVIGREPAWGFTPRRPLKIGKQPTRAEQALIDEAEALLTEWWDKREVLKEVRKAAGTLLLAGRAGLRVFVPAGELVDGQVPTGDLAQSLERIYVEHPAPEQALVETQASTRQQRGLCVTKDAQGQSVLEISVVNRADGMTVLRVKTGSSDQGVSLPLGGRLLLHEMRRDALITEPVRQNQKLLNLSKTMQSRNVVTGGFLERTILNAQMPGEWVADPNAPNGKRWSARPYRTGPGRTNFLAGYEVRDTSGKITGYTSPSIVYRDPSDPATFITTKADANRDILAETRQLHTLISGDATASAVSRVQARADFAQSLLETKPEIDALIRWLLEVVLALASHFAGQAGRFDTLRATCDARIDTGPLTPEERAAVRDDYAAGLIDREMAMSLLGVEDVDAAIARIDAERAARQATAQAIAQTAAQPQQPGAPAPSSEKTTTTTNPTTQGANQ